MKKKHYKKTSIKTLSLCIFFICSFCFANTPIDISILTCTPGTKTYSTFGHSAIRIIDHDNALDTVYNFGVFNFNTPNFTLKFISGELQYMLGKQQTQNFIDEYTLENRTVIEQQLQLDTIQTSQLVKKLQFLYRPENRYYTYSFLNQNCATKIRDILISVGVTFREYPIARSNRKLINQHLQEHPWFRFGTNLLLGKELDTKINMYHSMFLPKFLYKEIKNATNKGKKILTAQQILNTVEPQKQSNFLNGMSPSIFFSSLCFLFLFWFPKPIAFLLTTVTGISGLFLLIIWLLSSHTEVKFNMNILWCNPLYLAYILMLIKKPIHKIIPKTLSQCLWATVFIWIFGIQSFDIAIVPILILLGILNWRLPQYLS